MESVIERMQNELAGYLATINSEGVVNVKTFPENPAEFSSVSARPHIYCMFSHSKANDPAETSSIMQNEWMHFDVVIMSRVMNGRNGIYDLYNRAKRLILGRKSCAGDEYRFDEFFPFEGNVNKDVWCYVARFKTRFMSVAEDFCIEDVPLFKEANFDINE